MPKLVRTFFPFFAFGCMMVLLVIGLIIFSYLLIWGAMIGFVLFAMAWIKNIFFPQKKTTHYSDSSLHGRIIEHDDDEQK